MRNLHKESVLTRIRKLINLYWRQGLILSSVIIVIAGFFPSGKTLQYSYQIDDIARDPIIAPFTFPILKAEVRLQDDLNEAKKSEPFLFIRNDDIVNIQIQKIHGFFELVQEIRQVQNQFKESKDLVYRYRYEPQYDDAKKDFTSDSTALSILQTTFRERYSFPYNQEPWKSFLLPRNDLETIYDMDIFKNQIVQLCRDRWAEGIYDIGIHDITSYEVLVNQDGIPTPASPDDYNDLETAWIKSKVQTTNLYPDINDERQGIGYNLLVEFMKPNLIYDKETTERRRQSRLDRVPRFQGTVLENERIVDANTRITVDILQKLASLSATEAGKEKSTQFINKLLLFLGRLVIIWVVISFFFTFLLTYRKHIFDEWKLVLLMGLLFLATLGMARVIVINYGASEYIIPLTVAAMSLTILFDARIGFMSTTSLALLTGIMIGNNLEYIIVAMFTSSVAMYNIRQLRTRSQLFTTIFALIGASVLVIVGLGLFKGLSFEQMKPDLFYLVANSILSPVITYGLIGLFEMTFGITTDLTLIELSDFDHPLLKRLQQEANGTFNHCIVVGNLAEACANAIDARALLCRVGAYYHDIGKMVRPEYFIENQFIGENKHTSLSPFLSSKIVKNHVRDGLKLAEEYGLPKIVSDFIPMHHGNTRVEYFYRKALNEAKKSDKIDESGFRYPGPKPNTKETGILMICEAAEAAVRSIKDPDIMKIEEMLDKIIRRRIEDGQLNECPLTLDELNKIKGTVDGKTGMLPVLRGIYHIRIEYPEESKIEETEDGFLRGQA